ncbi:MAG: hypothetical protein FWD76_06280 [Firmicutes bacterium]|nr:hypothetical protein [Bacillota bacterium]
MQKNTAGQDTINAPSQAESFVRQVKTEREFAHIAKCLGNLVEEQDIGHRLRSLKNNMQLNFFGMIALVLLTNVLCGIGITLFVMLAGIALTLIAGVVIFAILDIACVVVVIVRYLLIAADHQAENDQIDTARQKLLVKQYENQGA